MSTDKNKDELHNSCTENLKKLIAKATDHISHRMYEEAIAVIEDAIDMANIMGTTGNPDDQLIKGLKDMIRYITKLQTLDNKLKSGEFDDDDDDDDEVDIDDELNRSPDCKVFMDKNIEESDDTLSVLYKGHETVIKTKHKNNIQTVTVHLDIKNMDVLKLKQKVRSECERAKELYYQKDYVACQELNYKIIAMTATLIDKDAENANIYKEIIRSVGGQLGVIGDKIY